MQRVRLNCHTPRTITATSTILCAFSFVGGCVSPKSSGTDAPGPVVTPLARQYIEGETARYLMTGSNQGREHTISYTAEAQVTVKRDEQGRFFEEFRWMSLQLNGQGVPLDQASADFRQRVSLDGTLDMTPPAPQDIARINPMLIGPVFDLMTFYVDLHPSLHQGKLAAIGDRVHVPHSQPNSWADGTRVILGEDCIDFELTLTHTDDASATLNVRHVPPEQSSIRLPASWMHERINPDRPNNWVQVQREQAADARNASDASAAPRFVAAAGHETFDVVIIIDRPSGTIRSATMDNPVDLVQRTCNDEALTDCGEPVKFQIRRRIELRRLP
jgi:hypothetical protein